MALPTEEMKTKAEVYHGDEICREKLNLLLAEIGLPNGLVTASQEIEEYGFVKAVGLVWLKHRKKAEQKVADNVVVSYDTVVSAYVEPHRIRKLRGVKAKEFLNVWVKLSEIHVNDGDAGGKPATAELMITFKTPVGLSRSFPVSAFE
ncbi:uncharacterized protein LOC115690634 [Syzygium oleosum]|uniref:uncharacterized protein LOC115690634 n=1 Tax=Syzygium oleosum TaxID=219896 RepID=UPI0011D2BA12|nr:uncharacterized protein LOC115690634 [Syzygium oleosum]